MQLKIEILDADGWKFIRDEPAPLYGIRIEGPIGTSLNAIDASTVAVFVLITIPSQIAINVASNWIYDYLIKHKATHIRIDGHEPKNKADLERVISEQIEIGKND